MSEPTNEPTYSISLRIQRIRHEYAFVSVPVTSEIMDLQPDGTGRIDFERFERVGIELSKAEGVDWYQESDTFHAHPLQTPPPWAVKDPEA